MRAPDVVHGTADATLVHVEGDTAQAYVHNYGTTGILARVTLRLEPAQDWSAFYASFAGLEPVLPLLAAFAALEPTPRLVSVDPAGLVASLPPDPALPDGRASLRVILDRSTVEVASALVLAAGGRVEDVRPGASAAMRLSTLSSGRAE
ncbi:hypothetical protein [Cryptosporangium arvum]|uniref:hypothetical protein n=1 Tax=Cryptosporangium arvum TaxID=80871 RepID=UPI0004ACBB6D|nr:hypothetical protein [Cryptosporangium arvum]